jgi:hypothetical protein
MSKKAIAAMFSVLVLIGLAGTFWGRSLAEATSGIWNSCPRGSVNCYFPGDCHSYIDTNRDSICDRSQPSPQVGSNAAGSTSGNLGLSLDTAIVGGAETGTDSGEAVTVKDSSMTESAAAIAGRHSYNFVPITVSAVVLYAVTWLLSSRKVITQVVHRRIWNLVLLVSSLVSIIPGGILTLNLDLRTRIPLPFNLRYWHVEAGIVLGIVALFHIIWHWRYFIKLLKVRGSSF